MHSTITNNSPTYKGVAGQCSNALYARDTDVPVPNVKPYTYQAIRNPTNQNRLRSALESGNDCITPALDRTSSDILLEDAGYDNAYAGQCVAISRNSVYTQQQRYQ